MPQPQTSISRAHEPLQHPGLTLAHTVLALVVTALVSGCGGSADGSGRKEVVEEGPRDLSFVSGKWSMWLEPPSEVCNVAREPLQEPVAGTGLVRSTLAARLGVDAARLRDYRSQASVIVRFEAPYEPIECIHGILVAPRTAKDDALREPCDGRSAIVSVVLGALCQLAEHRKRVVWVIEEGVLRRARRFESTEARQTRRAHEVAGEGKASTSGRVRIFESRESRGDPITSPAAPESPGL